MANMAAAIKPPNRVTGSRASEEVTVALIEVLPFLAGRDRGVCKEGVSNDVTPRPRNSHPVKSLWRQVVQVNRLDGSGS